MSSTDTQVYLPGLHGLDWKPDGKRFVADADYEFVTTFFDWKKTLTAVGYSIEKRAGRWVALFQPGKADKAVILSTILKIREHRLGFAMKGK